MVRGRNVHAVAPLDGNFAASSNAGRNNITLADLDVATRRTGNGYRDFSAIVDALRKIPTG